jgi:hypothetical protein
MDKLDVIVTNILNSSDIGRNELKKIIIKQWADDKKIKKLEKKIYLLERFLCL